MNATSHLHLCALRFYLLIQYCNMCLPFSLHSGSTKIQSLILQPPEPYFSHLSTHTSCRNISFLVGAKFDSTLLKV